MQIGDATRQATAPDAELDDRMSSMAATGAEIGTAANGQTKAEGLRQMDAVVERDNLWRAYERVMRNKGAAGVDGLTVLELKAWLQQHWPSIRTALLAGDYMPAAIRKVDIPKPNGGVRTLGIPTVLDRLIQQALLQVLQPAFDSARIDGTPQGGPLSPLLSNILLTDLDRELERRGHRFCRYADDCNIYVKSDMAGQHAMAAITDYLEKKLKLQVNRDKSAVARPWKRKFLGYSFTWHKQVRLKIADSSLARLKDKVRDIVVGNASRKLAATIEELNPVLRGWTSYFRLTEVKGVLQDLDGWIRRKLRCLLWRQWKRPATRNKRLQARGLDATRAWKSASNGRGPWWNAGASHMNAAYPKRFFDVQGLVSLLDTQRRFQRVK